MLSSLTRFVLIFLSLLLCTNGRCTTKRGWDNNPLHECLIPNYWQLDIAPNCSGWNFTERNSITSTQDQYSGDYGWTTIMWFSDAVWSGTLLTYQQILQHAFTYAVLDLDDKWRDTLNVTRSKYAIDDKLVVSDIYVNVTFFLGFCLLKTDDCTFFSENELSEYEADGQIAGEKDNEDADYYVYSTVYGKEQNYEYIHYLMRKFGEDYITFASMRLQCSDWGTILNETAAVGDNVIDYQGYAFYAADLKVDVPWSVPYILNYIVYGFVIFCVLFAIAGAIHGFGYWKADCIRVSGIIYFGLYTWDFYSDIVFTLSLWDCDLCPKTLFYAAAAFVIVPWIANMVALSRYQNKWCKDETIRERVYQWFVSWQRLTYALAALSGSAFGTVELANSYVFGLDFFCMGLNERHLKKFNNNRLYSSILVENAPQICVQIIYLTIVSQSYTFKWTDEYISLMALCTSTLSVGAALLDIYASKKLFSVLKQDGQYLGKTSCSISVVSPEIKRNATRLQISTYAFREAVAETLSTHPRSVEMHFPIATSTGFKMKFTVFSSKLTPDIIKEALKTGSASKLPQRIQQQWRLIKPVAIPIDKIEVEKAEADAVEGEGGVSNGNIEQNVGNQIGFAGQSTQDFPAAKDTTTDAQNDELEKTEKVEGV